MAAKEGDIVTIERLIHAKYIDVNAANGIFLEVSTYIHN